MICIDNSEWMRNGDYSPTRFQAQAEAINLICGAKTQSNPENTVGIMTTAGKGVRVLVTPTSDFGKILASMHGLEVGGEVNLTSSVQIAQLALKHRQNKKQQQRIIMFTGSPVKSDKKILEVIGKKLKKNNVALDIVDFGEDDDGKSEKLDALLASVNSNENSHIVHVPAGPNVLTDVLISSAIFTGDGEAGSGFAAAAAASAAVAAAAAAGGTGSFDFGVDPNLDPELALALRVSMEEERARQEAAARRAAEEATAKAANEGDEQGASSHDVAMEEMTTGTMVETAQRGPDPMEDEAALLEQALAMSMSSSETSQSAPAMEADTTMAEAKPEDQLQDLAFALEMLKQTPGKSSGPTDMSKVLGDQNFVSSVLSSLPGVDPNDPSVKDLLASLKGNEEEKEKGPEKPKEGEE